MELLQAPWPWYVSGPLIGLLVPLLLLVGSTFGISRNLETLCSVAGAYKISDYFDNDWKSKIPGVLFVLGTITGGFIGGQWLTADDYSVQISNDTIRSLERFNLTDFSGLQPSELFNFEFLSTPNGIILMIIGGFLIGFGTRYAGGCTSGHAITGLSSLQLVSFFAAIGFFIGGLITTHFIYPILFSL